MYLSAKHIERIRLFRSIYERAVDLVGGLPWLSLVPLHYRESEIRERGGSPGEGAFGCDPGKATTPDEYARKVAGIYGVAVPEGHYVLDADLSLAALVGAHELKTKARRAILRIGPTDDPGQEDVDEDALFDAYWGYNGISRFHSSRLQAAMANALSEEELQRMIALPDAHAIRDRAWSSYVSSDPVNHAKPRLWLRAEQPDPKDPTKRIKVCCRDERPGCLPIWRELLARRAEIEA